MSMRIDTEPGERVVFKYPTHGYESDQKLATKYLQENEEYTVSAIEVGNWRTDVTFDEVPGVQFNSVLFDNIKTQRKPYTYTYRD
jgi:hypothetical protein